MRSHLPILVPLVIQDFKVPPFSLPISVYRRFDPIPLPLTATPFMAIPPLYIHSKTPAFGKTFLFQQYCPNEKNRIKTKINSCGRVLLYF